MADTHAHILIKKKKAPHGTSHGGAWKVAYADFVTAMMALFIVLWLTSSTTKQQQQEIAGYFRDPKGTAVQKGTQLENKGASILLNQQDMTKLKAQLLKSIERVDMLDKLKKQIEITITPEGLRIELMEDAKGTFFKTGKRPAHACAGRHPKSAFRSAGRAAEPYLCGGTYGCAAIFNRYRVRELGALLRPCECNAPADAVQRGAAEPGGAGTRFRRSAPAEYCKSFRRGESAHLAHRPVS